MAELQEIILRARFILANAPRRLEVFRLVNGRLSTKEISLKLGRKISNVGRDLQMMREFEIIKEKIDKNGNILKKDGATVYEKHPLLKHVPESYFQDVSDTTRLKKTSLHKRDSGITTDFPTLPSPSDILQIAKEGETHLYEFKSPGTTTDKITKEIAGYVHTKNGGIIFYGIDDDGSIIGSDKTLQELDQSVHNSVHNTISPPPQICIDNVSVLNTSIIVIRIKAWDRKTIYEYTKDKRYYIRKGTNVFALTSAEITRLSKGEYVDE